MAEMKIGSLFDGAGGFPLAGLKLGFNPVWASEIEPFPIRITTKRLPQMIHIGNIENIEGDKIEPVDVITFGSPCQDLSVAGKRKGLDGEQSSLFNHAIRIITEMRAVTKGKYPRFIVWENVPGAFISNGGEDYRVVLKKIAEIKDPAAAIPRPKRWSKTGNNTVEDCDKWQQSGCIMGNGYSIAWRVLDAQYFGVPQRRKRIYLVGDFGGNSAPQILFKPHRL